MVNEILFRGKRIDGEKQWVYGYYYPRFNDLSTAYIISKELGHAYEVDPKTVGQFKNLFDKHEEKIFDGDILSCVEPNSEIEYITTFSITPINGIYFDNKELALSLLMYDYSMPDDIEIIGNIHDNPELKS